MWNLFYIFFVSEKEKPPNSDEESSSSGGPPPYIGCVSSISTPLFRIRILKEKPPDSDDESSSRRRPSTLSFACSKHAVCFDRTTFYSSRVFFL
jgi:hypothetical protein